MSEQKKVIPNWKRAIKNSYAKFMSIDPERANTELGFALKIVSKNPKLQLCDPDSIIESVVNIARTNLTLNPVLRMAYLIPRRGSVCCLEPSYMGLIALLKETGSVRDISARIVYCDEKFIDDPISAKLVHEVKYAKSEEENKTREIFGAYSRALLPTGELVFEFMPYWELKKIEALSQGNVYEKWDLEMYKKTIMKRHFKTLLTIPGTKTPNLSKVLELENQNMSIEIPEKKGSRMVNSFSAEDADFEESIEELLAMEDEQSVPQAKQLPNNINEKAQIKIEKPITTPVEKPIEVAKVVNEPSQKAVSINPVLENKKVEAPVLKPMQNLVSNETTNPVLGDPSLEIKEKQNIGLKGDAALVQNSQTTVKREPLPNVEEIVPDFNKRETVAELFKEEEQVSPEEQVIFDMTQSLDELDNPSSPEPQTEDEYELLMKQINS